MSDDQTEEGEVESESEGEGGEKRTGAQALGVVAISLAAAVGVGFAIGQGGVEVAGLPLALWAMGLAFVINWLAYVPSYLARTEHYFDLTGSLTYLTVVVGVCAYTGVLPKLFRISAEGLSLSAPSNRHLVVAAVVVIWALRLGSFLFGRIRKVGKDGRFDALKKSALRFLIPWTLQGLWVSLTLAAALAVLTTPAEVPFGIFGMVGLGVWVVGFGFEVVADAQKSAFKNNAANAGKFIQSGLWRFSRHPNYFGEIVLWVGVAVMAWPTFEGWRYVGLISPVFVTLLLTKVSGIPMLEERADEKWGGEDEYERYKRRTSVLVPLPPSGD